MSVRQEGAPPSVRERPRFTPPNTCSLRICSAGIDNARLELNGPEVPILDGSAQPFIEGITAAGSEQQDALAEDVPRSKQFEFQRRRRRRNAVVPAEAGEFKVTVMVDYESPVLGTQHARLDHISDFGEEIASSRTFVFLREVANLANQGLYQSAGTSTMRWCWPNERTVRRGTARHCHRFRTH